LYVFACYSDEEALEQAVLEREVIQVAQVAYD